MPFRPEPETVLPTSTETLERENAYLKLRVAQLTDDVADLNGEVTRLQQVLERLGARKIALATPNPLSGGQ
jgi:cell division protein FtsB